MGCQERAVGCQEWTVGFQDGTVGFQAGLWGVSRGLRGSVGSQGMIMHACIKHVVFGVSGEGCGCENGVVGCQEGAVGCQEGAVCVSMGAAGCQEMHNAYTCNIAKGDNYVVPS